jgi:subtilase family serine protease
MKDASPARIGRATNAAAIVTAAVIAAIFATAQSSAADRQILRHYVPSTVKQMGLRPVGTPSDTMTLDLVIGLPLRDRERLETLLQQLYDPASSNFHHWITPQVFGEMFGPTEADYQTLCNFARANGLTIITTYPDHTLLKVRTSVANINKVFHVTMRLYQHPQEARTFYAPDNEPSLDLNLPILHITGLDNYIIPRHSSGGSSPGGGSFTGKDFRAAYLPNVSLDGSGQRVGIYDGPHGFNQSDITMYEDETGISRHVTVTKVLVDAIDAPVDNFSGEVTLDIQMAIAMAPGLSQVLVYEDTGNIIDALKRMAMDNVAKQLSLSWQPPPQDANAEAVYQQIATQGQSFLGSSADDGAYYSAIENVPTDSACTSGIPCQEQPGCCWNSTTPPCTRVACVVPQWATDSNITIVGGTVLTTSEPAGTWQLETVWKQSGGGWQEGKGGAQSEDDYPTLPTWQQSIDMSANHGSTKYRNSPDVSMVAQNVFTVFKGANSAADGTSASAPLWAGLIALVNQQAAKFGKPSVGFLNPAIYALGKSAFYTSYFHDITAGDNLTPYNTQPDNEHMYRATKGYDLCTGWGTPNGISLINALALGARALTARIHYVGSGTCDPGPRAQSTATFALDVEGGTPPFTYRWYEQGKPVMSGGKNGPPEISLKIPLLGKSLTISATVTDQADASVRTAIKVSGLDPSVAEAEENLCKFVPQMDRFKHPLYINPGDPGPLDFQFSPYSRSELDTLEKLLKEISVATKSLQQRTAPANTESNRTQPHN